jgi:hypothetical protein
MPKMFLLLLLAAPLLAAGAERPLAQEIYLWQRRTPADLGDSLEATRGKISGLSLLAAEVSWENSRPDVWYAEPAWAMLRRDGRPLTLVLRVGPWAGKFERESRESRLLCEVAGRLIATARAQQIEPAELQIDFDCAQAKLAGYRAWLLALKEAVGDVPLGLTALPSWLEEAAFPELVRTTGRYVLQVHSLEKPTHAEKSFTLCEPQRALAWAARATSIGVPFRIALPTYGYEIAFDPAGKFLGLSAERPRTWPAGTQTRSLSADPAALATLVETWQQKPPRHCTGLIWFRLPAAGDTRNWPLPTLFAVMEGRIPTESLAAEIHWRNPTLAELVLANTGETNIATLPTIATSSTATPLASDALAGYTRRENLWLPATPKPACALAPGERRVVGWLRFAAATPCTASVSTP